MGGVTSQKDVPCVENCSAAVAPQAVTHKLQVHETCTDLHRPVQMSRLLLVLGLGRHQINIRIHYVNTCLTLNWNSDKVQ